MRWSLVMLWAGMRQTCLFISTQCWTSRTKSFHGKAIHRLNSNKLGRRADLIGITDWIILEKTASNSWFTHLIQWTSGKFRYYVQPYQVLPELASIRRHASSVPECGLHMEICGTIAGAVGRDFLGSLHSDAKGTLYNRGSQEACVGGLSGDESTGPSVTATVISKCEGAI